ncbi:MAG: O-antigen ligase family protein [Candidatus Tantalella remota]|nr:O-antigen ligase family protein [Candidatus Tantalella remota]
MRLNRTTIEDILLIGILLFAPLALASVHTWAYCTIALVSLILFNLHFLNSSEPSSTLNTEYKILNTGNKLLHVLKIPLSVGMLILLGIIFFYIVPLPAKLISLISPNTYKLREAYTLDPTSWFPLSLYPRATITYLIKFPTYIMLFLVVVSKIISPRDTRYEIRDTNMSDDHIRAQNYMNRKTSNFLLLGALCSVLSILLHSLVDFNLQIPANAIYFTVMLAIVTGITYRKGSPRDTRYAIRDTINYRFLSKLVNAIIIIAFVIAVFSILQKLSYNGKLYWLITKGGSHFGPYVNYDHYAGYMEMCIFLALGKFISLIAQSSLAYIRKLKDKIIWFSSKEANSVLLYLFLTILMTTSLFMSTSRGGIMSFCAAFVVFSGISIANIESRKRKRLLITSVVVVMLIVIMFAWVGPEETLNRFKGLNDVIKLFISESAVLNQIRPDMWLDTVNMWRDYSMTGVGPGCYRYGFSIYRTFAIHWGFLNQAHCDYLQLISEMGLFGWGTIIIFLGWYVRRFRQAYKRLRERG